MTITISLLSRGPCIYRPIQRKYGEYDHKLLDRLGSGEIARTICSCAYHKRGGSSYVIGVAFAPNHASRSHLSFPPYRLSFLGQFAFQLINTSLSVLSLSFPLSLQVGERPPPQSNRPDESFPYSSLVRSLLSLSPPLPFFSFPFSSFAPLFTLYQCSTRLLGIPDGVPAHATGSPATLDFVLWNPNTLVWSAFLGPVHGATVGNPWTKARPSSRYGTGYVKHCSSTSSRGTERRGSCDGNNND